MRSEILDTGTFRSHFDDMPDGFKCEALAPDLSWPIYSPEERTCAYPGCIGLLIHSALRPRWNQDCADVLSFANKVGDHPMFLTDLKISQLTAAGEFRTAFFDCSKSGSRSIVLGLERLVVFFRRAMLAASYAAFSMVIYSRAEGLERRLWTAVQISVWATSQSSCRFVAVFARRQ